MHLHQRLKACFFVRLRDRSQLETTEFYAQDLAILRDLGFDVRVATTWGELRGGFDLYYIWWWTRATAPLMLARLRGRPAVVTGAFNDFYFDARPWVQRQVIRLNYRLSTANVAVSQNDYAFLHGRFPRCRQRLAYVPHSVDTDFYSMGEGERDEFCLTVCWMRRTNAVRKCMFELIEAVPEVRRVLPRIRFVIAGDPEDGGPELRGLAERLGVADAVDFLGRVTPREKVRLMQTCLMYVQPSRYEGFGLATAEAMACGAPVVTSLVGAVPEVAGDLAEYVDGSDPSSIARGIVALALRPEVRRQRSIDGRRRIEAHYATARRREELGKIIDRLLRGSRSGPVGETNADAHPW
jgi:glycosyltransferase involved in cell wall biosynthesis